MKRAWSTVVRRNPTINNGDRIGYYDGSSTKQARKNTLWEGRGKVIQTGNSPEDSVTTDWYSFDWNSETLIRDPLPNDEALHLDRKYCYKLKKGFDLRNPNRVDSNPEQDTYIVTGVDEDGLKIKRTPQDILLNEKDMHPMEQYGPAFIKRNQNSQLYVAQMLRSCIPYIKVNTWERDYGINLTRVRRDHLNTFAHSKVKGFMWLFLSHALPVGTRL
jgi:hypothetical protein